MHDASTLIAGSSEHTSPDSTRDFPVLPLTEPKPWSFWPTIGFSAIIAAAFLFAQLLVVVPAFIVYKDKAPQADIEQLGEMVSSSGLVMSIGFIVALPVVVGLSVLFSYLRKGITVRQYLGIHSVTFKQIGIWLGAIVLFSIVEDVFYTLVGAPIVHLSSIQMYETVIFPPLLFFVFIVCAPIVEECFYRGFLFKGLLHSWMGPVGATLSTALMWAMIHTQYEWYGIVMIFIGGILLGIARIRTGSIVMPMLMHCIMNIIASVQLIVHQHAF
jgi:membrane protease YdiL (CAAX protease family)